MKLTAFDLLSVCFGLFAFSWIALRESQLDLILGSIALLAFGASCRVSGHLDAIAEREAKK